MKSNENDEWIQLEGEDEFSTIRRNKLWAKAREIEKRREMLNFEMIKLQQEKNAIFDQIIEMNKRLSKGEK